MSSLALMSTAPPSQWLQEPLVLGSANGLTTLNSLVITQGSLLTVLPSTILDNTTAASTTTSALHANYLGIPTINATNTGIITTTASTLTIAGAPVAGTNETITNSYALNVQGGLSRLTNWILGFTGTAALVYNSNLTNSGNSFALYQGSGGDTVLNTASGTQLGFKVNNSPQFALQSNGTIQTALSSLTGSPGTTTGSFVYVTPQTFQDTTTAASGTAGSFSGSYLGAPTLTANNIAVTTPVASTLTIAGPPTAGTNETITNSYALNVLSGNSLFNGTIISTQQLYARMQVNSSLSISNTPTTPIKFQNFQYGSSSLSYSSSTGLVTVTVSGPYLISCLLSIVNGSTPNTGTVYIITNGMTNYVLATSYVNTLQFVGSQIQVLSAGTTIGLGFNNPVTLDGYSNFNISKIN